jgi:hypothetical protein
MTKLVSEINCDFGQVTPLYLRNSQKEKRNYTKYLVMFFKSLFIKNK